MNESVYTYVVCRVGGNVLLMMCVGTFCYYIYFKCSSVLNWVHYLTEKLMFIMLHTCCIKDVFGYFFYFRKFFFIFESFFYIYIRCRKLNADFNKLIKITGQCARGVFRKMMLNTKTFANKFDIIWTFSQC